MNSGKLALRKGEICGEARDIEIAFERNWKMRDLNDKIMEGKVRCTARNRVKGYPGETFHLNGKYSFQKFIIVAVWYWPLGRVRDLLYPVMGFASPEQFQEYWLEIKYEFDENRHVYVHFFDFAEKQGFGYWPDIGDCPENPDEEL
jgi:hypothetical protein